MNFYFRLPLYGTVNYNNLFVYVEICYLHHFTIIAYHFNVHIMLLWYVICSCIWLMEVWIMSYSVSNFCPVFFCEIKLQPTHFLFPPILFFYLPHALAERRFPQKPYLVLVETFRPGLPGGIFRCQNPQISHIWKFAVRMKFCLAY